MTSAFIIDGWTARGSEATFRYHSADLTFEEKVRFPVEIHDSPVVVRLLDLLAVVAGVSYAKAVAPTTVEFPTIDLSDAGYDLVCQTYDEGMREFAFHNKLPLTTSFVINDEPRGENYQGEARSGPGSPLIPFGAGRDSCVVASALRHLRPTLLTIGENPYAQRIADTVSLPLLTASRTIDPRLIAMNESGAPNGHVPVTAINSLISLIVAELTGHTSVVMANEKSASQPTRIVDDIEINHQHSKSLEYEEALAIAADWAGSFVRYTSVLRNSSDYAISRAFATKCTDLHPLFMSCNQAMLRDASRRSDGWCCNCPKCRGMFLSLAPFMSPEHITEIFGVDMLNDEKQIDDFHALMTDDLKPFECVADVHEARQSMLQLLKSPMWSQHVVVQASREIASQQLLPLDNEESDWSDSMFEREIESFLEDQP